MEVTYQIKESELNYQFFQGLKKTFKGKKMTISIKEQSPNKLTKEEFEAKISNAENSPVSYVFEGDEFEEYTRKRIAGEFPDTNVYKNVKK
jgi:hypothetical protein